MNQRVLKNLRKERNKSGHDTLRSKISQKQDGCNIYICIYIYIYIHNIHIYIYIYTYICNHENNVYNVPSLNCLACWALLGHWYQQHGTVHHVFKGMTWHKANVVKAHFFHDYMLYIYMCVCVYIYKFISLSIYLSIFLSIHLPICLYNIYRFLWVLDVCRLPSTFSIPVF